MFFENEQEFLKNIPKGNRLLGLDISPNNIGLAISDSGFSLASPLDVIRRKKFTQDLAELKKIIIHNNVGGLIIGLPLSMDGAEGKAAQSIKQFGRNLLKDFDIPIFFLDERLSSFAADEVLSASGFTREKKKSLNDKVAASLILEGFLKKISGRA